MIQTGSRVHILASSYNKALYSWRSALTVSATSIWAVIQFILFAGAQYYFFWPTAIEGDKFGFSPFFLQLFHRLAVIL